jgi:ABC-type transporter Mla subunit MlaD
VTIPMAGAACVTAESNKRERRLRATTEASIRRAGLVGKKF